MDFDGWIGAQDAQKLILPQIAPHGTQAKCIQGDRLVIQVRIKPMIQQYVREIVLWEYDPPYSIYNLSDDVIPNLVDPMNRYFAILSTEGEMIGYSCFGKEARVPGGDYEETEPIIMDVGLGMNPKLVGGGGGVSFVRAVLRYAQDKWGAEKFRVTIAGFNMRSRRTFQNLGFLETHRFERDGDGFEFIQYERKVQVPHSSSERGRKSSSVT